MANLIMNLAVMAMLVFGLNADGLTNSQICSLSAQTGKGRAYFERWYYNNLEGVCQTFVFGGGEPVNGNNFETEEKCLEFCDRDTVCEKFEMDPDEPHCLAYFENYKYNPDTNRCEMFVYGGCGGNANNFGTQAACETKSVCEKFTMDPDEPHCYAYFENYKYNPDTNRCEMFVYGGCGGNANNFGTQAACETKCIQM